MANPSVPQPALQRVDWPNAIARACLVARASSRWPWLRPACTADGKPE
jgi:hypothetical protein